MINGGQLGKLWCREFKMFDAQLTRREWFSMSLASLAALTKAECAELPEEPAELQRELFAHEERLSHSTSAGQLWHSFRRQIASEADFDLNKFEVTRRELSVEEGTLGRFDVLTDRPRYALMEAGQWLARLRKGKSVLVMSALHEETHFWTDHCSAADPFLDLIHRHGVLVPLRALAHGEAVTIRAGVDAPPASAVERGQGNELLLYFSTVRDGGENYRFRPASPHSVFLQVFAEAYLPEELGRTLFKNPHPTLPAALLQEVVEEAAGLYANWERQMRNGGDALFEMLAHFELHELDYTALGQEAFAKALRNAVAMNLKQQGREVPEEQVAAAYKSVLRIFALESLSVEDQGARHAALCRDVGAALLSYDSARGCYSELETRVEELRRMHDLTEAQLARVEVECLSSLIGARRADQDLIAKGTNRLFPRKEGR